MKTLLVAVTCLMWGQAGFAQTAPTPTASGSAAGTKNVGADRADAPQAPGMTTNGARATTTQPRQTTRKTHPKRVRK